MYGLAAGLIVAVLGVVAIRQLNSPPAREIQPVTLVPTVQKVDQDLPVEMDPVTLPQPIPTLPGASIASAEQEGSRNLSEADLMAADIGGIQRRIAGRAEWMAL